MDESINSNKELKLPRRRFVSAALLSGIALFSDIKVNAVTVDEKSEFLLLPRPADALIDFLDDLVGIESGILGPYYHILGKISREIAEKYETLRNASKELQRIVPKLKLNNDLSSVQNIVEISKLSAVFISSLPVAGNVSLASNHSKLVNLASADFEKVAVNWKSQKESITLSDDAVKKLREILELIENLKEPTEVLTKATNLLTSTSNKLREQKKNLNPLIIESARLLIGSDLVQFPPSDDALSIVLKRLKEKEDKKEFLTNVEKLIKKAIETLKVNELIQKATENLEKVEDILKTVNSFSVPTDLQNYREPNSQTNNDNLSINDLQMLVGGIKAWIKKEDEKSKQINDQAGSAVQFLRTSMSVPAEIELTRQIRKILTTIIPESNDKRLDKLWWKKIGFNAEGYDHNKQFQFFYNYIPQLPQIGEHEFDKNRNDDKRRDAAEKLARLRTIS